MHQNEEEIRAHLNGEAPEKSADEKKNYGRQLAITFSIELIMVIALCVWKEIYNQPDTASVFRLLSDCFLVPGALFAGIGGFTWIGSYGFFDMMSYGCSSVFGRFIPFDSAYRRKEKFYDYRQKKEAKGRSWKKDMVVSGFAFILLSVVFMLIEDCL